MTWAWITIVAMQSLVNEVTAEDVLNTARKFIDPDKLVIAVAGPYSEI